MRRSAYIVIALAGYIFAGYWTYTQWWEVNRSSTYYRGESIGKPGWYQAVGIILPFVLGAVFTGLACSSNIYRVYDGVIVDREFVPAYTIPGTTLITKVGDAIIAQQVPPTEVPDAWSLRLRRSDGREGWVSVSEKTFNRTRNGQYIDLRGM